MSYDFLSMMSGMTIKTLLANLFAIDRVALNPLSVVKIADSCDCTITASITNVLHDRPGRARNQDEFSGS
jgi:hypothetical protein